MVKVVFSQSKLDDIDSWAYQLQEIDVDKIAANNSFDLIVIDYSADGSDGSKFTLSEIEQIKLSGKKAISYISIGEAENYRFYWDENWDKDNDGIPDSGTPEWLGSENENWEGNYKVKFWFTEWQTIIFQYIDKIIAQGFDGIYCDIIDAYYYWSEENPVEPNAANLMIQFLSNLKNHINNDDFIIIPQNGSYISFEDNISEQSKSTYFNSIDAIGVEDVFFFGELDENNNFNPDSGRIENLKEYLSRDKKVFSIEYLTDNSLIETYQELAEENNFVPYASVRALDTLTNGLITQVETNNKKEIENNFSLSQNYPNPFNSVTNIKFTIPTSPRPSPYQGEGARVRLIVYDMLGREIKTLINKPMQHGEYNVTFGGSDLSSGIYLYRLEMGRFSKTRKMILLK